MPLPQDVGPAPKTDPLDVERSLSAKLHAQLTATGAELAEARRLIAALQAHDDALQAHAAATARGLAETQARLGVEQATAKALRDQLGAIGEELRAAREAASRAIASTASSLALPPDGAAAEQAAVKRANELSATGDHDGAIALLESHLDCWPASPTALATLAQLQMHRGRVGATLATLLRLLRHDPTSPAAWNALAAIAVGRCDDPRQPGKLMEAMLRLIGSAGTDGRTEQAIIAEAALALLPDGERVRVLDGGARDAHLDPRWRLLPPGRLEIHGFEPDEAECRRLNADLASRGIAGSYHPIGLWDREGVLPFHVNRAAGGSSFLEQNRTVTDRWKLENPVSASLAREVFLPERTTRERVTSVNAWACATGITAIDFLKLNVQGGELRILAACGSLLRGALGLLIEVAFVESYRGRPLFADIDAFARANGFVFLDLVAHHYVGRATAPLTARHLPGSEGRLGAERSSWGQLIEGHALYLRDPVGDAAAGRSVTLSEAACLRLAAIADAFGQTEFALELLDWLNKRSLAAGDAATAARLAAAVDRACRRLSA